IERNVAVHRRNDIPPADLDLICTVAQLVVTGSFPTLVPDTDIPLGNGPKAETLQPRSVSADVARQDELLFDNGFGGFTAAGREYVINLAPDRAPPPMPWVNVIANEAFGF